MTYRAADSSCHARAVVDISRLTCQGSTRGLEWNKVFMAFSFPRSSATGFCRLWLVLSLLAGHCTSVSAATADARRTVSSEYDCREGLYWDGSWSHDKQDWCCKGENIGCSYMKKASEHSATEDASSHERYDCRSEMQLFQIMWTQDQKDWCCVHESIGCDHLSRHTGANCLDACNVAGVCAYCGSGVCCKKGSDMDPSECGGQGGEQYHECISLEETQVVKDAEKQESKPRQDSGTGDEDNYGKSGAQESAATPAMQQTELPPGLGTSAKEAQSSAAEANQHEQGGVVGGVDYNDNENDSDHPADDVDSQLSAAMHAAQQPKLQGSPETSGDNSQALTQEKEANTPDQAGGADHAAQAMRRPEPPAIPKSYQSFIDKTTEQDANEANHDVGRGAGNDDDGDAKHVNAQLSAAMHVIKQPDQLRGRSRPIRIKPGTWLAGSLVGLGLIVLTGLSVHAACGKHTYRSLEDMCDLTQMCAVPQSGDTYAREGTGSVRQFDIMHGEERTYATELSPPPSARSSASVFSGNAPESFLKERERMESAFKDPVMCMARMKFPAGSAELTDAGKGVAVAVLHSLASQEPGSLIIEGHVGRCECRPNECGCVSLSAARAKAVVAFLEASGCKHSLSIEPHGSSRCEGDMVCMLPKPGGPLRTDRTVTSSASASWDRTCGDRTCG
eukprot:TRINITY_DN120951_c0_g1_i1.p1 TRINITY_DN120951_c0_g1~~TRINITY_DN120951_c0_g1_i1.p1  ORF type:complete len:676 (-),score=77.84 TRINITY_DN120951_c0_g1_i1:180-2207(-)